MSTRQTNNSIGLEFIRIGPDDPRYLSVVDKRFNKRFSARPDYVRLVSVTGEVVSAVEDAVREGRRLVVTSGGHCLCASTAGSRLPTKDRSIVRRWIDCSHWPPNVRSTPIASTNGLMSSSKIS